MAESERYLPALISRIEKEAVDPAGLRDTDIVIRSSGCPNGCSRPYVAEIALVGKAPGLYNVFLGGAHDGTRVAKLVLEGADEDEIVRTLASLLRLYRATRRPAKSAATRGLALEGVQQGKGLGSAGGSAAGGLSLGYESSAGAAPVPLASEGPDGLLRLRVPDDAKAGGPLLRRGQAQDFESFGDWVIRSGYVAPTIAGRDFHDLTGLQKEIPSVAEAERVLQEALAREQRGVPAVGVQVGGVVQASGTVGGSAGRVVLGGSVAKETAGAAAAEEEEQEEEGRGAKVAGGSGVAETKEETA